MRIVYLAAASCLAATSLALAAPGEIDRSFANQGVFRLPAGVAASTSSSAALYVTTDAQQRPIVAGYVSTGEIIARLATDGSLDAGFGDGGILHAPGEFLDSYAGLRAYPTDGDGVLVGRRASTTCFGPGAGICAQSPSSVAWRRLDGRGAPDASYGPGRPFVGAYGTDFDSARLPDGRVVIGAYRTFGAHRLTRLDAEGRTDTAFEENAAVALPCAGQATSAVRGMRILPRGDGTTLVAQLIASGVQQPRKLCFSSITSTGHRNATFGASGEWILDSLLFGNENPQLVKFLAKPSGGAALVINLPPPSTASHYVIVHLGPDGRLDATRPDGGIAGPTDLHVAKVNAAAIQSDGRILLAGLARVAEGGEPRVGRILDSGGADLTFGPLGRGYTPLNAGGAPLTPEWLHLGPEDAVYVAGSEPAAATPSPGTPFAVVRLQGRDPPPSSGGGGGGCGMIGTNPGTPPDPTLPLLALSALVLLLRRSRRI